MAYPIFTMHVRFFYTDKGANPILIHYGHPSGDPERKPGMAGSMHRPDRPALSINPVPRCFPLPDDDSGQKVTHLQHPSGGLV